MIHFSPPYNTAGRVNISYSFILLFVKDFCGLNILLIMPAILIVIREPGSSVGIANELRTGRSGIESRWGRGFPPFQTGPGTHPVACKMGTGSFPGVNCGRSVLLTTHPLLVPRSWKNRAIPPHTLSHTGPLTGSL